MIGHTISHYRITEKLGKGGMGEVYRARDAKLNRDVALKILPQVFAQDSQRMARFEREAQVLASLNHPHIAQIHGLEETADTKALVLELVEGETLQQRIRRGPIPVDEALELALQICEGLEAAHENGIIHRDLKPANIKVTPEGRVKILDFGLAKALDPVPSPQSPVSSPSHSPTISRMATQAGMILGTASYMSPEQARGKPVDRRTDIWAFGCVLYEMLTGGRAFGGDATDETVSDILASVLKQEPDWLSLPERAPVLLRSLLRRCLKKDPTERVQHIGDARIEVQEALEEPEALKAGPGTDAVGPPRWRSAVPWGIAAVAVTAAVTAFWNWPSPEHSPVSRLAVVTEESAPLGDSPGTELAVSPEGERLVYRATREGESQLYVRPFDELRAKPIQGTEGTGNNFFLSPDGEWVVFSVDNILKKVSLEGGSPITLCDTFAVDLRGGSWDAGGTIVFVGWPDLYRIPAAGGEAERLTPGAPGAEYMFPQILPGGDTVLVGFRSGSRHQLTILSLKTRQQTAVVEGSFHGLYVLTGHLVYARLRGPLVAVPFELETREVKGEAVPVCEGVRANSGGSADFAISRDGGTLVYVPGAEIADETGLWWVDRRGQEEPVFEKPLFFGRYPRLSPDGRLLAVTVGPANIGDVWVYDLAGRPPYPVTQGGHNERPIWTPDEKRLAFAAARAGPLNIHWIPADGSTLIPERLLESSSDQLPRCWSPDGRELIFLQAGADGDLMAVSVDNKKAARPLVRTQVGYSGSGGGAGAALSPDGRWLAYDSRRSGEREVWVQPYPGPGRPVRISLNGGYQPVWSREGDELYFLEGEKLMAVAVRMEPEFQFEPATMLFEGDFDHSFRPSYDVAPDGRFLMIRRNQGQESSRQIKVVLNWFEELKRLAPTE